MRTEPHLFAGRQTLILSMPDVKQVLSVAEAIALQRLAFEAHAQGKAWNAPNTWLPVSPHARLDEGAGRVCGKPQRAGDQGRGALSAASAGPKFGGLVCPV